MIIASNLQPTKACPVVIRKKNVHEILAFEHPLAGMQLVKGTIEPGESSAQAALRELYEESGVSSSTVTADLGAWASGFENQIWSFQLCKVGDLPDSWLHRTADDGGHNFKFFWHPILQTPTRQWHWVYRDAISYLSNNLHT